MDEKIGESHCLSIVKKLDFNKNFEASEVVTKAQFVYCSGFLKNGRGAKLYCVLFNTGFIVSRPNHDGSMYLLYRKPISIQNLCYESEDRFKTTKPSSSFNSHWIRIYSLLNDSSFMLFANDEHSCKQWISILDKYSLASSSPQLSQSSPKADSVVSPRKRPVTTSLMKISPKRNKCDNTQNLLI